MRISVVQGEEGHELYASVADKSKIQVLLDGRPVNHVIAADDQAGQVRVAKTDAAGKVEFEVIYPKEPWEETVVRPKEVLLSGTVEIIVPAPAPTTPAKENP